MIDSRGNIYTFGAGVDGQLGHGNKEYILNPTKINGFGLDSSGNGIKIVKVSCGDRYTAMLDSNGNVYTFGSGEYNKLGQGNRNNTISKPTRIKSLSNIVNVSCGNSHTLVVDFNGNVYGFGNNSNGQLGHRSSNSKRSEHTPIRIKEFGLSLDGSGIKIVKVSCSGRHSAILDSDGNVYTFGNNMMGQLGHGDTILRYTPTKIAGINGKVVDISCGLHYIGFVIIG